MFINIFGEDVYEYSKNQIKPIVDCYLKDKKGVLLDAACGRNNVYLDPNIVECMETVGLDNDPEAIRDNRLHKKFLNIDIHNLNVKSEYNYIISVYTFEHLVDPQKVMRNFYEALTNNGILIIIAPNRLHYVSLFERLLPSSLKNLAWRILKNKERMPYPAYFRLCARKPLLKASDVLGFDLLQYKTIETPPIWFMRLPPLFFLLCYWMKLVNNWPVLEWIRGTFVVILKKI